ncbi:uncharacterized protein LOC107363766 isoform X1 [Tetranychus urticae]|uniref:uncharacterized protein LOC107363766 isoform X1 n=1 Tax=Tetranychus urticae TaxID=32264 RepID=UPI000D64E0CC|nr:uncharacterized protein LOC107363766 isoform X1 [Tetranychus urticae]
MKILVLFLILCSSFNKLNCTASLINLPLRVSDENVILHATLVDKVSSKSWFIKEYLSAAYSIHGKIEINSDDYSYTIFYNKKHDNKRLVIYDNECAEYTYDGYEHWDKMLPGVTSSLTNMILLLGPSIVYRLQSDVHSYIKGPTMKIRGVDMESLSREISPKLKITIYHKLNQESEEGLLEPSRIEFNDYNLHLDILLQTISDDNHHIKTQVTPGVGCPFYMEINKAFPKLDTHRMHMIINERVTESTNSTMTNSEIYVDDLVKIVRMTKYDGQNYITLLYDYNIGVSYSSTDNKTCQLKEIDLHAPGLDNKNQLDLLQIFDMNKPVRYLGELDYNLQSGRLASAWESVEYNITYRNKQYDKLVVTIYMGKSIDFTGFVLDDQNYIPLSVSVKGYLKDSKNLYNLETNINREIHIYQNDFVEADARQILQLKECYSAETLDLTFQLISIDVKGFQHVEDYVEKIKDHLLDEITKNGNISPLRIENVDLEAKLDQILVTVTFSEAPKVDDIFEVNIRRLDISKITATAVTVATLEKCVQIQSLLNENIRTVIYCDHKKDIICESYSDADHLIDDHQSGALCLTIESQMGKLRQLGQQISLDSIHDYLLHSTVGSILTIPCENCYHEKYAHYKVNDIVDSSSSLKTSYKSEKQFKGPYLNRILSIDSDNALLARNVKNFGDCYRSCTSEYNSQCSSFSYCQTANQVKCILSSEGYKDAKFDSEASCNTYYAKYETKYHQIKSKRFKNIKSHPISLTKNDDCAKSCIENGLECYSYQFCETQGLCYFSSYYSQQLTESSNECDIYIPKKIHNYQLSGPTVIMNTNHIELDLNIDQCASLCSGWENNGNERCKSFNFCPKSKSSASSCFLSAYTVHDENVQTTNSSNCRNYKLISEQSINGESHTSLRKHNSSSVKIASLAFFFAFVGLVLGLVSPLIVGQVKSFIYLNKKRDFSWDRQVDELDETGETTI